MVTLMVSSDGVPGDPVVGVDARWQCWAGSEWATTHIIYRGFGDLDGQTIPLNENFQIQVPDIGLALDESYPIVIPQVTEGTYRIADEVFFNGGQVDGFVIVDVTGNG
jgi:hypothetical protein